MQICRYVPSREREPYMSRPDPIRCGLAFVSRVTSLGRVQDTEESYANTQIRPFLLAYIPCKW